MPDREFLFALNISDQQYFDDMLGDVASSLLNHVGYSADAAGQIVAALHQALAEGAAGGRRQCDVRFSVGAGELQIVVSYVGGREWRTARPLP